jgi:hypothetical protein
MTGARDILRRFRPVGVPGTAAARGVPADRVAEASAELAPVFTLLEDVEDECDRIRGEAEDYARARAEAAAATAASQVAEARRQAEAERAEVAAAVSRRSQAEAARTLAAAHRQAEDLARVADRRLPEVVARLRETMAGQLAGLLTSDGPSGRGGA